jgi:NAD-reducing hydrogenase small subunit
MKKLRLATVWLDGCSGCHMSALDMDERWIELADLVDLVYGPLVDTKDYPENVDVVLVEGAVSSEENLEKIQKIRTRTKIVVSLGDCAVTSNVPSMRNRFPVSVVESCSYVENAQFNRQVPRQVVPRLLPKARPVHEFVKVDVFVPGCPPSADTIYFVLTQLLAGKIPDLTDKTRFGA